MKLKINAKCSDMCQVILSDDNDDIVEVNGYVPNIKGIGGGDYIEIEIDLDTDKVIGLASKGTIIKTLERMAE